MSLPYPASGPLDLFVTAAAVPGQGLELLLARWPRRRGDFSHCLEVAHRLGVAPAFALNVMAMAKSGAVKALSGPEVEATCLEVRKEALHHFLRWEQRVRAVLDVWEELSLPPFLVMKGGGTKYTCYEAPWLRSSSDLDLLVPEEAAEDCAAKLMERGFEPIDWVAGREFTNVSGYHLRLGFRQLVIELHRAPSHPQRGRLNWAAMVGTSRPLPELHPSARTPSPQFQCIVNADHALKEGMLFPLRDLVDLHLLLRDDHTLLAPFLSRAQDFGLGRAGRYLAEAWAHLFGPLPGIGDSIRGGQPLAQALPARLLLSPNRIGFFRTPLHRDTRWRKLAAYWLFTPGLTWSCGLLGDFAHRRTRDLLLSLGSRKKEDSTG